MVMLSEDCRLGEPKDEMAKITSFIGPKMPKEKPRYLMGVGTPEDILNAIENGSRYV